MELLRDVYYVQGLVSILVIGILGKLISWVSCHRLYRASMTMDNPKGYWVSTIKKKIESYYQLEADIHNVGHIVDKYIKGHSILGINLAFWEQVPGFCGILSMLLGCLGAVQGILAGQIISQWGENILVAAVVSLGLLFVDKLLGQQNVKERARVNILHYVENILPNRMKKEAIKKEVTKKETVIVEEKPKIKKKPEAQPMDQVAVAKEFDLTQEDLRVLKEVIKDL